MQDKQAAIAAAVKSFEAGNHELSLEQFMGASKAWPEDASIQTQIAVVCKTLNRLEQALQACEQASRIDSKLASPHFTKGNLLKQKGEMQLAVNSYLKCIELDPNHVDAHLNLGILLREVSKLKESKNFLIKAVQLRADYALAHCNLALTLQRTGESELALKHFETAIQINPRYVEALAAKASCHADLGEHEAAIELASQAISLKPDYVEAINNLGTYQQLLGKLKEAKVSFERALELRPNHPNARYNLALVHLLNGELRKGFRDYEVRYNPKRIVRDRPLLPTLLAPRWIGEPLANKTILVWHEQGAGDGIQTARFAQQLKALGATVWLATLPSLLNLLKTVPWFDKVVGRADASDLHGFDFWVMSFSLPHLLDIELDTMPAPVPYLSTDKVKEEKFRALIERDSKDKQPVIGLVWAGNPEHSNDKYRSITLQALSPLADLEGVRWVSFQKGHSQDEAAPNGMKMLRLHSHLDDYTDTAAALKQVDLLVSVDTSLVHLAGALNVPTVMLLPANPDWRWLAAGDKSPWYPRLEIARQTKLADWAPVVLEVKERIKRALGRPHSIIATEKPLQANQPKLPEAELIKPQQAISQPQPTAQSAASTPAASAPADPVQVEVAAKIMRAKENTRLGNYAEATEILGHVLKEFKDQPDALYEMGRINFAREEYGHASQYFERALKALQKLDPKQRANFEGGWARDLGVAYQRGGNDKAAVQVFVRSQQIRPDVSIGKFLNKYWNQTEGTHLKQAIALQKSGKDKEAEKIYRQILTRDANNGEALHFLGCILLNKTDFKEAEVLLRRAITLNPASAVYHRNLAALHIRTKRPEEALRLWRHALTLDTIEEGGINDIANAMVEHGAYQDAVAAYKKALEKNPNSARTLSNLGRAYTLVKSDDDAKEYLIKAMGLDDKLLDPPLILSRIAVDQGDYEDGRKYLALAKKIAPRHPYVVWSEAFIGLGIYYDSEAQSKEQMSDFLQRMKTLEKYLSKASMTEIENGVGYRQPYEIAYFDQNNKEWLAAYGRAICSGMKRWQKEHKIPTPKTRVINGPIRVGIVMGFFFNHSVWNALVKGWMMASPKQDIEFHAFYTRPIVDKETERAKGYATTFHPAPKSLKDWAQTIADTQCDVLIYPEIGMEPVTLKLAAMRLAPVQVGSWGHAEGTGLPTIDYYLTGDLIEPANAQDNYSEKIVRLPNLGCYVEPWAVTPEEINPEQYGLDPARPWLVCPGSPYKYRPEHDQLWLSVAKRLPNAQLLFFLHTRRQGTSNRIRGRLERLFAQEGLSLNNHAVFLPWLNANRFFGILKRSTVFLDTIGFSGFNTAQQGIECGLPIVTIEGKYMRGMLGSALLRRIGATDTIVESQEDYIECASRLVEDSQFAESVRAKMASGIQAIYRDQSAMDGFVKFIKSVTNYKEESPKKKNFQKIASDEADKNKQKESLDTSEKGKVTIAIPAYNLQFFEQALVSAQQQDYENIEILVSDDSPDNRIQNIALKRSKEDDRIRYVKNEKNLGFFGNFTQCFKLATGQYIKYLNDDDLLLPGCISEMVKGFELNEKIELVFSKRKRIDEAGRTLNYAGPEIKSESNIRVNGKELGDLILQKSINLIGEPTTVLFKKESIQIENANIFSWQGKEFHCYADVSLWLRLLSRGDAFYIANTLSAYRIHKGQEQRKPEVSVKCIAERFYVLEPAQKIGYLVTKEKLRESLKSYENILNKYERIEDKLLLEIKKKVREMLNE